MDPRNTRRRSTTHGLNGKALSVYAVAHHLEDHRVLLPLSPLLLEGQSQLQRSSAKQVSKRIKQLITRVTAKANLRSYTQQVNELSTRSPKRQQRSQLSLSPHLFRLDCQRNGIPVYEGDNAVRITQQCDKSCSDFLISSCALRAYPSTPVES